MVGNPSPSIVFGTAIYQTDLLDLAVPHLGIEMIPARPGHAPVIVESKWIVEAASGAQTSPATVRAGSDPLHSNYDLSNGVPLNGPASDVPYLADGPIENYPHGLIPNAPVFLDVIAGAQGTPGFALLARLNLTVVWVAA